jgi:hypothetical protein
MRVNKNVTHELVQTLASDEFILEKGDDRLTIARALENYDWPSELMDFSSNDDGTVSLIFSYPEDIVR